MIHRNFCYYLMNLLRNMNFLLNKSYLMMNFRNFLRCWKMSYQKNRMMNSNRNYRKSYYCFFLMNNLVLLKSFLKKNFDSYPVRSF
jgi:hypothetical protein